jgi:hypothetical protein
MTFGLENTNIQPAKNYTESLELQRQQFVLSQRLAELRKESRDHTKMNARSNDFAINQEEINKVTETLKQLRSAVELSSREVFTYSEQLLEQPENIESKVKSDIFISQFDAILQSVSHTDKRFVAKIKSDLNYKELSKNDFQLIKRYFLGETTLKEIIVTALTSIKTSLEEMSQKVISYLKDFPNVQRTYNSEQINNTINQLVLKLQELINQL